jgi:tRNA G18 (ribose-2'-O)-methylase SpoU
VTAEKWVPIIEVPVNSVKVFLEKKKREGFSILGLEQTANSIPLDQYVFPTKTVSSTNSSLPVLLILKKKNNCKICGHYLSVVVFHSYCNA